MKLSALQQSPNLLLNALQSASATMVAASTSITDPLPQSVFTDTGTVGAPVGGNLTLFTVPSTALYGRGEFYTFDTGVVSAFFVVFAILPTGTMVVNWSSYLFFN